jgi:glycosyltransferase involved in cell wall biosynthesis
MDSISVVIPVYNGELFLIEQINSIISDLTENDEIIIIDDYSTDNSIKIIESINSKIIKIYKNDFNVGVIKSIEIGLNYSKNKYIFLSDQDDIWVSGKKDYFLKKFSQDKNILLVVSEAGLIDSNGYLVSPSKSFNNFSNSLFRNLVKNTFQGCCLAMDRRLFQYILPFPRYIPMHDSWIGASALIYGVVSHIDNVFTLYRRHTTNLSPSTRQPLYKVMKDRFNLALSLVLKFILIKCSI